MPPPECQRSRGAGFAIGIASHGIGTRARVPVSERAGAFAALAMGIERSDHRAVPAWIITLGGRLFAG